MCVKETNPGVKFCSTEFILKDAPLQWSKASWESSSATEKAFLRDSGCQDLVVRSWLPLTLLRVELGLKMLIP